MEKRLTLGISPLFFFTAFLIGFFSSQTFAAGLIWVGAIFLSIFVHELGHALGALGFGLSAHIQFTAFGGATTPIGAKLSLKKEFVMVLLGPLFSVFLLLASLMLFNYIAPTDPNVKLFFEAMMWINLVWTIVNLFPVMPLDGGQLLRVVLEGIFGIKGRMYAAIFGGVLGLLIALAMIPFKLIIISILFFLFAFQNFEMAKQLKNMSPKDESEPIKDELKEALQLKHAHKDEADAKLEEVRSKTKEGMVFLIASQELAENYIEHENYQKAYEILKPLQAQLLDSGQQLLVEAAFFVGDDATVLKLAAECLINLPNQQIILRALASAARQRDLNATIGWLQTAKDYGCKDLKKYLNESFFDSVKDNPEFTKLKNEVDLES
jgi:Zn-dependent protease